MANDAAADQYSGTRAQIDELKRRLSAEGFDVDRTDPLVIDRSTLVSAEQEWTCQDLQNVADIFTHAAQKTHLFDRMDEYTALADMFQTAHDAQCS
jgi:hypothetical protein